MHVAHTTLLYDTHTNSLYLDGMNNTLGVFKIYRYMKEHVIDEEREI